MKTIRNISRAARKAKKAQSRRRNDWMPRFAAATKRQQERF